MAKKKKQSRVKRILSVFNPRSLRGGMALFALVFVLAGGGYYTYKSFAASVPPIYIANINQFPQLQKGSSGHAVESLRYYLGVALNKNLGASSTFDQSLKDEVKTFQAFYRLTVDGIVGKQTWTTILTIHNNIQHRVLTVSSPAPPNLSVSKYYLNVVSATCPYYNWVLTLNGPGSPLGSDKFCDYKGEVIKHYSPVEAYMASGYVIYGHWGENGTSNQTGNSYLYLP